MKIQTSRPNLPTVFKKFKGKPRYLIRKLKLNYLVKFTYLPT